MSKAVPLDHEFNKNKFAELLIQAKGDRSQTQFAQDCGLSVAHLNRYYNLKKEQPPIPSSIIKIAQNAKNDVSLNDLLDAAGYDPEVDYAGPRGKIYEGEMIERFGIADVVKGLSCSAFEWNNPVFKDDSLFDLEIDIKNSDSLEHWSFMTRYVRDVFRNSSWFFHYYGKLCCQELPPKTKVSLLIYSDKDFNMIKKSPPVMLPIYFSVILFDTEEDKIVKEEYLPTALELTDDLKTVFTLEGEN